ncbi:MAG TPA: hypothetical protein P5268_00370 [Candidatus Marinimicrobia bacterium]|nr:hypothetical protein [Candidatus Neomarinimicrobiota bacterium]HRS51290.1 hypothetical protein [Candidatus Neomarinimicrobiota bacterium]HRU91472.1 hypothetical protein [Candidatus Neomarinimicrobiota bacterium]
MKNSYRIVFLLIILIGLVGAQTSDSHSTYLFILTFANYNADPEIDWWREGFVDFLMDYFQNIPGLIVRRSDNPLTILNQIQNLPEIGTTECFILTGSYKINNQKFEIDLELINTNTGQPVQGKKISILSADMAKIIESVNRSAAEMLNPYLIKKTEIAVPQENTVEQKNNALPLSSKNKYQETIAATKEISAAIDKLSGIYSGAKTYQEPSQPMPSFAGTATNELSRKFGESIAQTGSFQNTINQIVRNPYKLEISDPFFRRLSSNDEIINVTFSAHYVLSRDLIQDMLIAFPHEPPIKNEEYVEYIFNGKRFAYSEDFIKAIARGDYRTHPVFAFITNTGTVACVLIDMPLMYRKNITPSSRVLFTAKYQPLINVAANGWNVVIQLKNTDIEVEYNLDINLEQLQRVNRIDVLFLSEADIQEYLKLID